MRLPTALAVLLLLCNAAPTPRDCAEEPGNLIGKANCGFDKDVAGWTAAPGATLSRAGDQPGQGVMNAVADPSGSLIATSLRAGEVPARCALIMLVPGRP